jgi:hypothetical protein
VGAVRPGACGASPASEVGGVQLDGMVFIRTPSRLILVTSKRIEEDPGGSRRYKFPQYMGQSERRARYRGSPNRVTARLFGEALVANRRPAQPEQTEVPK